MEKKKTEQKPQPNTYYGKKAYRIHPLLARLKAVEPQLPNYSQENIEDKKVRD